jgi:hypothetical protein
MIYVEVIEPSQLTTVAPDLERLNAMILAAEVVEFAVGASAWPVTSCLSSSVLEGCRVPDHPDMHPVDIPQCDACPIQVCKEEVSLESLTNGPGSLASGLRSLSVTRPDLNENGPFRCAYSRYPMHPVSTRMALSLMDATRYAEFSVLQIWGHSGRLTATSTTIVCDEHNLNMIACCETVKQAQMF